MKQFLRVNLLFTSLLSMLFAATSFSATLTSTQSGAWNSSTTWGGAIPAAGDNVIIHGEFTVTVNSADAVCTSLQLGGTLDNSGDGSLAFANGSHLKVSGVVTLGVGNRKGNINMGLGGTLSCGGFILNSHGDWIPGLGTIELTDSNTLPNSDITIFNNLTVTSGTTVLNSNIDISGDLLIHSGATLDGGVSSLTLLGNWVNDGTFNGNAGTVLFEKNGNQTITGTGFNNFNLFKVNMGISPLNTLEVNVSHFNAPDGFLTLSGGTLKLSGTFELNNTLELGPAYNIPVTSSLWINNPNITVKAQAGGVSLRGILRITAGIMNIGTSIDHNLTYVAGASLIMEGGSLNIAGNLAGNNSTSTLNFNQSGGVVTVTGEGSTDPLAGGFDLSVSGSSFIMSGGKIIVRNATSGPSDFINLAGTKTVTGGTIQAGDALSGSSSIIRIQTQVPVFNLHVFTAVTARLSGVSPDILNDLDIESNSILDAGGLNLTIGGNWNSPGEFIAGPSVTFSGAATQTLNSPGEEFNNLAVNKPGAAMTFNSDVSVNGAFTLSGTDLNIGEHVLALAGTVSGDGKISGAPGSSVKYLQGSDGQTVLAGQYGNLEFSGFGKNLAPEVLIEISGTFSPGLSAQNTTAGSHLNFNGADQVIPEFPYFHLSLSGTGTKHATGLPVVDGNLEVQENVVLVVDSLLVLKGTESLNHGTLHAQQMDLNLGAVLSNFHLVTVDSILTGAGIYNQQNGSDLVLKGLADVSGFDVSATGNTVNFSGANSIVKPAAYHNLMLSGSGTSDLSGISEINGNFTLDGTVTAKATADMAIGGNLSVNTGATFQAGGFTHSLAGDIIINGIFDSDTGIVRLNGTAEQHIAGTTYSELHVENSIPVVLTGDAIVKRSLSITNGALLTGDYKVTLESGAVLNEASGHTVTGKISITREIAAFPLTESFGNIGADLLLGGTAPGNTTVTRTTGIASQGVNYSSIKRYFDITPSVNEGLGAGLLLHYDISEIEGQNEAAFEIYSSEDEGFTWTNRGGSVNVTGYTVSISGVDKLSRFTISDTLHPLDNSGIPSAVEQPGKDSEFYVYPLPAGERLWFSKILDEAEVLNVYGQVVISRIKSVNSVSLDGLPHGTYFLRSHETVLKFIKE